MIKKSHIILLLYSVLIVFSVFSWSNQAILPLLKEGDWVFRRGTGVDSKVIRLLGGGQFSHMGVVVDTVPDILIVHAAVDDDQNHTNQVILSTLAEFLRSDLANHMAITRPDFLTDLQKQKIGRLLKKQIGQPFILNIRSKAHRYCTTIVEQTIKRVYPAFSPKWRTIKTPFFRGSYLFPDAFFSYPQNTLIHSQPLD